jgi:hypothetical protein
MILLEWPLAKVPHQVSPERGPAIHLQGHGHSYPVAGRQRREEASRQATERIEKKLMETGEYEKTTLFSRPRRSRKSLHGLPTRRIPS